ncbi:MAG: hypothetical protein M1519_02460 [Actinobacteria bacterium]|nr:hypothetical protein [Actinomycetota bacterium]
MNIFRAFASGARGAVLGPSWEGCGAGSVLGRVRCWVRPGKGAVLEVRFRDECKAGRRS